MTVREAINRTKGQWDIVRRGDGWILLGPDKIGLDNGHYFQMSLLRRNLQVRDVLALLGITVSVQRLVLEKGSVRTLVEKYMEAPYDL